MYESVVAFIIGLGLLIVLFLICREVVCWYNKTNERLKLEQERNELLRQILKQLTPKT